MGSDSLCSLLYLPNNQEFQGFFVVVFHPGSFAFTDLRICVLFLYLLIKVLDA